MEDHSELFEKYINGNLSKEETEVFESKLTADPSFNEAFKVYGLLVDGIIESGKSSLKKELVAHEALSYPSTKKSYFYQKIAASVLVVLALSALILNYSASKDYEAIYADYYEPYPNIIDPINRSIDYNDYSIYQQYELRNFEEIVNKLTIKAQENILSDAEKFYLAQSQLVLKNVDLAILNLKEISKESNFYLAAQWYLALAYIKTEKYEKAESLLDQIIDQKEDFSKQAEILKNLL